MAKYFTINLSPEDKKIIIDNFSPDGKKIKEEKNLREIELIVLQNIFRHARNASKKMDDIFTVTDCIDQVKNITDAEKSIRFTQEDMSSLKTGFEAAAGSPEMDLWMDNCYDLMKQIKDPVEEIKDEEKTDTNESGK